MTDKAATIDEYLAGVRPEQRAALNRLRKAIRAAAPDADECITYGLPGFRLLGRSLVAFGASERHCAFYPMSGTTIAHHQEKLGSFETSKGTIRFQPGKPIPAGLIRILVKARIDEIHALQSKARRPDQAHGKRKAGRVVGVPDPRSARPPRRSR
ncbi:MAG: iron chaperone [Phycisphaerae bacterium]